MLSSQIKTQNRHFKKLYCNFERIVQSSHTIVKRIIGKSCVTFNRLLMKVAFCFVATRLLIKKIFVANLESRDIFKKKSHILKHYIVIFRPLAMDFSWHHKLAKMGSGTIRTRKVTIKFVSIWRKGSLWIYQVSLSCLFVQKISINV